VNWLEDNHADSATIKLAFDRFSDLFQICPASFEFCATPY
jgi:hypothetical protein